MFSKCVPFFRLHYMTTVQKGKALAMEYYPEKYIGRNVY
uniref:Uncharacterized protein n=1 Tax=Anguilla anguilla TaxID=7936 RepID=A0A0E9XEQ5_ANGAN